MAVLINELANLIMSYFDDIRLIGGSVIPVCTARLDCRFMGTWSVEFMLSGRMTFGIDGAKPVVVESPIVFCTVPGIVTNMGRWTNVDGIIIGF